MMRISYGNPEQRRIKVFNKGTSLALKVKIPLGGHILPISIVGEILAAKNAQKKAKKHNFRSYK